MNWSFSAFPHLDFSAATSFGDSVVMPSGDGPFDVFSMHCGLADKFEKNEILPNAGFWAQKTLETASKVYADMWMPCLYGKQDIWAVKALKDANCPNCRYLAKTSAATAAQRIEAASDACGKYGDVSLPSFDWNIAENDISQLDKNQLCSIFSVLLPLENFSLGAYGLADIWNGAHIMVVSEKEKFLLRFAGEGGFASVDIESESLRIEFACSNAGSRIETRHVDCIRRRISHFAVFCWLAREHLDSSFHGKSEIEKRELCGAVSDMAFREASPWDSVMCASHLMQKQKPPLDRDRLAERISQRASLRLPDPAAEKRIAEMFSAQKKLDNLKTKEKP